MDKIPEKAILSYVNLTYPQFEFKIQNSGGENYLLLIVDVAKTDKNSTQFDEKYRKFLYDDELTGFQAFINRPIDKLINITVEIEKFFGVVLKPSFNFKNYDYLDKIEQKIREVISKTDTPEITFSFEGKGDHPIVYGAFHSIPKKFFGTNKSDFSEAIKKIEKIGKLKLSNNYIIFWTKSAGK